MRDTYKNKRSNEHVEDRIGGQEHQNPVRVGRQPDVVRANVQLERYAAEPAEHEAAPSAQERERVPQHEIRHDRYHRYVFGHVVAVFFRPAQSSEHKIGYQAG